MTEPLPSGFPEPLDNDDDDVAWALQTAKVQWLRAGKTDALVWIGRYVVRPAPRITRRLSKKDAAKLI